MLYVNLHKYASASSFPRTMNVNERKIKTNKLRGNHNVRIKKNADIINLIHKNNDLATYLKQSIHANCDELSRFELNFQT